MSVDKKSVAVCPPDSALSEVHAHDSPNIYTLSEACNSSKSDVCTTSKVCTASDVCNLSEQCNNVEHRCMYCNKCFSTKSNLMTHIKTNKKCLKNRVNNEEKLISTKSQTQPTTTSITSTASTIPSPLLNTGDISGQILFYIKKNREQLDNLLYLFESVRNNTVLAIKQIEEQNNLLLEKLSIVK